VVRAKHRWQSLLCWIYQEKEIKRAQSYTCAEVEMQVLTEESQTSENGNCSTRIFKVL